VAWAANLFSSLSIVGGIIWQRVRISLKRVESVSLHCLHRAIEVVSPKQSNLLQVATWLSPRPSALMRVRVSWLSTVRPCCARGKCTRRDDVTTKKNQLDG